MTSVAARAPAIPTTPPTLQVPADFQARLDTALAEGTADALLFAGEHTPAERWMVPDWALLRMDWPPKDDKEELKQLHAIAASRTPDGVAAAKYWSKHGLTDEWERMLEDYTDHVGPAQARSARKLLHDSLMMVNNVTQTAKAASARKRPFVVDPSLPLAVERPGNSPSYPSGHTSAAFAACMVLSHLMPDRREHFMGIAREASWARVYSGAHFPSDVVAGVKLASTVVSYLTRTSMAAPMAGSDAINPGIAGTRRRIPAAALAGPGLPGGGRLTLPERAAAAVIPPG